MAELLTVSQAARRLAKLHGVEPTPKQLSDLIYRRQLPAAAVMFFAGRRLIRAEHLDDVAEILQMRARARRRSRKAR